MKKIISTLLFLVISTVLIWAQGTAQIYFEKTTHDFGIFYEDQPKVTCKFKFTNTGDGPLVIHQAMASCGCTVPKYPKEPIRPGETGEITVTYDRKELTNSMPLSRRLFWHSSKMAISLGELRSAVFMRLW